MTRRSIYKNGVFIGQVVNGSVYGRFGQYLGRQASNGNVYGVDGSFYQGASPETLLEMQNIKVLSRELYKKELKINKLEKEVDELKKLQDKKKPRNTGSPWWLRKNPNFHPETNIPDRILEIKYGPIETWGYRPQPRILTKKDAEEIERLYKLLDKIDGTN